MALRCGKEVAIEFSDLRPTLPWTAVFQEGDYFTAGIVMTKVIVFHQVVRVCDSIANKSFQLRDIVEPESLCVRFH